MSLANTVFNRTLRPYLPAKRAEFGGVDCYVGSVFDRSLPDELPDYEREMRAALREHVEPGDRVGAVGGGVGVTAVTAANLGAADVEVIEATAEGVKRVRKTAALNDVDDRVGVVHGTIGEVVDTWGERIGPALSPTWCLGWDVLELDCEGGERAILSALSPSDPLPPTLLVESHGHLGSPTENVRERVRDLGYRIVSEEFENRESDVCVLVAVQDGDSS